MHESATPSSDTGGTATVDPALLDQMAYTVPQAAKAIAMGERTVWGLVHAGTIPSYKVGASRRISRRALLKFIEQQENAA